MPNKDALTAAVSGAVGEQQEAVDAYIASVEAQGDKPQDQEPVEEATPAPEGEGPSEVGTETPEGTSEAAAGGTEEPPTEYFGVDLSDIPPEKRSEIIASFKEKDRFLNRVQQRAAEAEKAAKAADARLSEQRVTPSVQEPAAPAELSDEDILASVGISTDDPMYEVKAEIALPLAKALHANTTAVQQMQQDQQAREWADYWTNTLDSLEKDYGITLPGTREDFVADALENNIYDPTDAFLRAVAPAQRALMSEAAKARAEALKALKQQTGRTLRPTGSAATAENEEAPKAKTVRDALRDVLPRVAKAQGFDFNTENYGAAATP